MKYSRRPNSKRLTLAVVCLLTVAFLGWGMFATRQLPHTPHAVPDSASRPLGGAPHDPPLFVVTLNTKQGFIDASGALVINARFDKAYPFSERLAAVQVGRLWGYIDTQGHMVIEPKYAMVGFFSDGLASFRNEFTAPWGYIDNQGTVVIEPQFDWAGRFRNGIAKVGYQTLASKIVTSYADVGLDLKYRFIDRAGNFVVQPSPQSFGTGQPNERILINVGELAGYCNSEGKVVIEPQFESALPFSEGLACVYSCGAWGYIDPDGQFVIEPRFKYPNSFSDGLAGVPIREGEWGFIDPSGDLVIEPQFAWVYDGFRHGLAKVAVDRKIGYINRMGEWVWQPSD